MLIFVMVVVSVVSLIAAILFDVARTYLLRSTMLIERQKEEIIRFNKNIYLFRHIFFVSSVMSLALIIHIAEGPMDVLVFLLSLSLVVVASGFAFLHPSRTIRCARGIDALLRLHRPTSS